MFLEVKGMQVNIELKDVVFTTQIHMEWNNKSAYITCGREEDFQTKLGYAKEFLNRVL